MAGWLTPGFLNLFSPYGGEKLPLDTNYPNGQQPQSAKVGFISLAAMMLYLSNFASKTTVSGTRYYSSFDLDAPNPSAADGGAVEAAPVASITGIMFLVGSVGGTDNCVVELHDVNGVLLATSALAGTLVGTAGIWQQVAFTTPYVASPGKYFLVVQTNGTTAHPAVYNFPAPVAFTTPLITGSATGTLGTSANFTPATTYTANVGPVALPY